MTHSGYPSWVVQAKIIRLAISSGNRQTWIVVVPFDRSVNVSPTEIVGGTPTLQAKGTTTAWIDLYRSEHLAVLFQRAGR
jgi:hypothetical protein